MCEDLRIMKTKKFLCEAMLDEIKTKKFEDIKIKDICDKAMVRRATFYNHFDDKFDLFAYMIRTTLKKINEQKTNDNTKKEDIPFIFTESCIEFLSENTDLITSIKESELMSLLFYIIFNEVKQELLIQHNDYFDSLENIGFHKNLLLNYHFEGVIGVIKWWVEENYPITKEELISQIMAVIKGAISYNNKLTP